MSEPIEQKKGYVAFTTCEIDSLLRAQEAK